MWNYTNYNELYHFGIKGMKWGVRRYQNEDGSYTEAGKRRRNSGSGSSSKSTNGSNSTEIVKYDSKTAKATLDEDTKNYARIKSSAEQTATSAKNVASAAGSLATRSVSKVDTSSMTDAQLQSAVNRARLEQQYDDFYNTKKQAISTGVDTVSDILTIAGGVLAIGASAASLMVSIQRLKA